MHNVFMQMWINTVYLSILLRPRIEQQAEGARSESGRMNNKASALVFLTLKHQLVQHQQWN